MSAASRYASKVRSRQRRKVDANSGLFGLGYSWDDRAAEQLGVLEELARDFRLAWPEVGKIWAERQQHIFATGSLGRWTPLASRTILKKRREHVADPAAILVDSGDLKKDLTRTEPRSSGPGFAVFGPPTGSVSPTYAKFHVLGQGGPQRHPVPRFTTGEKQSIVAKMRKLVKVAADLS